MCKPPSPSLQVHAGVVMGLKEQSAILMPGRSGIDLSRDGKVCSLSRVPTREGGFRILWRVRQVMYVQYIAEHLELTG